MSNNKQSSVEWFLDELLKEGYIKRLPVTELQQAKAMHKSEIIWAHGIKMKGVNNHKCVSGEQYYNETFGGENNGEITTVNNIPGNINTTGNILDNRWTRTLTNDRTVFETDLWNKMVNWDKMNQPNKVMDEEQAPYNVNGDKNNKIADPYNDNHVYIDEVMLDIYVDMYLDHGYFDFDVPEWLDDAWEGDAEKDLASAVLYSFRMFLENRDWVNEDNDGVDEDKWDESFI